LFGDPRVGDAEGALRMATLGGALALGVGSRIGSIEPGKAADFVCIDLSPLACQPPLRPAEAVLFAATRGQIADVWISGRAAVAGGRLLAFDEQEISALARQWAERVRLEV
jgi:5-methylthioadenosine/S-adenosylhomocysteine deaminase